MFSEKSVAIILSIFLAGSVFADEVLEQDLSEISVQAEERLENIDTNIQDYLKQYYEARDFLGGVEKDLIPLQEEAATLESQLSLLDDQITRTSTKLENIEIQTNQKKLEIAKIQESLQRANIEMEEAQKLVLEFVYELYMAEKQVFSSTTQAPDLVKLLLSKGSASDALQNISFLEVMQQLGEDVFFRLEEAQNLFLEKKEDLERTTAELAALKNVFENEQRNLLAQREGQANLLAQTQAREAEYQKLIQQTEQQEKEALVALANLRENRKDIEAQLAAFESSIDAQAEQKNTLTKILSTPITSGKYDIDNLIEDIQITAPFLWPVNPEQGISAYYEDNAYENYFGVAHEGVDIPIAQGSPVLAPASGYVQEVADNGMGYSYIILAHKDDFATLYGHMSDILVEEGELVQIGSVIGRSGGTPGTKGAGTRTTGAHLHFEIFKSGVHVNPLNYLPLELLPKKYWR